MIQFGISPCARPRVSRPSPTPGESRDRGARPCDKSATRCPWNSLTSWRRAWRGHCGVVMAESEEYNPLDYDNLTADCIRKFMEQPAGPMPPHEEFTGSGVYALYYDGDFP